ncbi:endonuclease domain-containing protein [Pseudonocardia sp. RS11V-5]|uniref:endonuclease domain-containing protein n=1 Tax=Pseudonocardia terrae TaxID=2905831 RepID=UPI001E486517|nr:endonuclease domain-containing protein [Pseudonocardia terrae]MCE3551741.1 endonuclease domain-containing protein [Pseudonocardia terrae]
MVSVEVRTEVSGWPVAFRGSAAVAAGLVTPGMLRGPRFRRVFPDVYVCPGAARTARIGDAELRARAAYALVEGRGVLAGYAAALLHGADCGPLGAPADVTLLRGGVRPRPGLVLHRDRLGDDEVGEAGGTLATTARRTAFDLVRWAPTLVEAVVALDALANVGGFLPEEILKPARRYPRARGGGRVPDAVDLADRRAGSPPETRMRLALIRAGLPRPEVQWVVQDPVARRALWVDLAYPDRRVGLEYEGADHTRPDQVLRDTARFTTLVAAGWRMFRFTRLDDPERVVALVRAALR